jgi:uridylate kinase
MLIRNASGESLRKYAEILKMLSEQHELFVVTGGGRTAREYIGIARELGADETFCDYIGIAITRINAMLLAAALRNAPRTIPQDFREALELSRNYKVVVMGGTFPGHTTDATAALLAEFVSADMLLIATSVDGVYSDDPQKDHKAVKYERLKPSELVQIVSKIVSKAGSSSVVDLLAAKIIERSGIRTIVFYGTPENIEKAVRFETGTVIEK